MAKHVIKNDNAERRYKIQKVIRYRTAMETLKDILTRIRLQITATTRQDDKVQKMSLQNKKD